MQDACIRSFTRLLACATTRSACGSGSPCRALYKGPMLPIGQYVKTALPVTDDAGTAPK